MINRPPHPGGSRPTYQRVPDFLEKWGRGPFIQVTVSGWIVISLLGLFWRPLWLLALPWMAFTVRGWLDLRQRHHAVLYNYPVLGHLRYLLESIRPEIQQYFVEDDQGGRPFDREERALVYQRAKGDIDTLPFGTRDNLYEVGAEWIRHSLYPSVVPPAHQRVRIGGPDCTQPYDASLLNISAMSYGALSRNAILALNQAARAGGFYHNTGEGGISPHHLRSGGDLCWQIGTGYFGCRTLDGRFSPEAFQRHALRPEVKLIEIKLSQGAKPAHGGILPASKVSEEVSRIRGVRVGEDVISPPVHAAFDGPDGLLRFVAELRELSGGKPVGFKLCVGQPEELLELVYAMTETGITPDFITVDGGEGGTGAAPLEFSNKVGVPLEEGLVAVHKALLGAGLRERVRIISAGRITTGFHVLRHLALGADLCNAARSMMFALGCIQALKCNTNHCPTGIATQKEALQEGLDPTVKAIRVANYHRKTVGAALELIGAAGLDHPARLRPSHIVRRISPTQVCTLADIHPELAPGALLQGTATSHLQGLWEVARTRYQARRAPQVAEVGGRLADTRW